jgi:threonine dehydrogenase-like Zn-dependent dehydrogenase
MMRVMLLAAPGRFEEAERAVPAPGPGQLLLRTEACGLCASELDVFLGRNPWQQYPALLGHEVVGRVVAAGAGVEGWRAGDLVAAALAGGGYGEQLVVEAAAALPAPSGLAPHLALAEPLSCAVNSLAAIGPAPDDRIVVLGAGFIGLLLVQLLRAAPPRWLLVAGRRMEARALAHALGATEACAPDTVQQRVWELTGGQGADVVVEATGSEAMLAIAASMLRPEGTLAIVGYHQGAGRRVPVHEWNWKALRIANCHFRAERRIVDGARRGLALAGRGALDLERLVTHRFGLTELQRAFETAAARPSGFVKAVIVPN